ncbi:MAG: hypothetical protein LBI94_00760 [Treponema sp.]|nr:hypothetical protein [Treponema sp.]
MAETGNGAGEGRFSQDRQGVGFDSSLLWESCLMDVFFEAGHIVSNSPVLGLGRSGGMNIPGRESPGMEFPGELQKDLAEARSGLADYFILVLLSYPAADRKTKPEQVDVRIYGLEPYRFVYEETGFLAPAAAAPARPVNETEQAKRFIRLLIPRIKD